MSGTFSSHFVADSSSKPPVVVIGRILWTAPDLFGADLDEASLDLEPIVRFFRAADVNVDWTLSVVEFHTLIGVIMKNS